MIITAEISHYPLSKEYEESILLFISTLKENSNLRVYTNSMSTYVVGNYQEVFSQISACFEIIDQEMISSTVIKIINRRLPVEKGNLNF